VTRRSWVRPAVALAVLLSATACSSNHDSAGPTTTSTGDHMEAGPAPTVPPGGLVVPLSGRPSDLVVALRTVWVTDDEANVVRRLDSITGKQIGPPIPVGTAPIAISGMDGNGMIWVAGATGTVVPIFADQARLAGQRIELGGTLVDIAAADHVVWVADIQAGIVRTVFSPTGSNYQPPVPIPAGVVRLALTPDRAWVTGQEDRVTPIDRGTGAALPSVPAGGLGPIGADATSGVLWVANSDSDTVSRLDAGTGRPLGDPIAVGHAPIAALVQGDVLWVLDQDGPDVIRLDAKTGRRIGTHRLPMRPRGMALSDEGAWIVGVDPPMAVLIPRK
jgi:DNA-binding beta-propeller fold protein YncE